MNINPLDPHTTFPRSLQESSREQIRVDRPIIHQDYLDDQDIKAREAKQRRPLETQETQQKILRQRERERERQQKRDQEGEKEREGQERKELKLKGFERGRILDQRV